MDSNSDSPIGIFDSGVGGLSVLRAIRERMPNEAILYFGDQAHIPYGPRPMEQIRRFSGSDHKFSAGETRKDYRRCMQHGIRRRAEIFAREISECSIRRHGASSEARRGIYARRRVGVLATLKATFQGELYASVVGRFANGVEIFQDTCDGLVRLGWSREI
ncbi:MAG: hypothetical protein U0X93_00875 [Anaerolineales bacterium]